MVGIIYKFTILTKYKFDGHKPFYVGQHWGSLDNYFGSGSIWDDFLKRMKKDYPTCWRKLIKREVLYQRPCSQTALDKMEEYYIKKEKAHYSYKLGGCNVLWGTANNFGSGSPMKDPMVVLKRVETVLNNGSYNGSKNPFFNKKHSLETRKKISLMRLEYYKNNVPNNLGKHHSEESKTRMSEAQRGKKSWMYGRTGELCHNFGRLLSEETKRKISEKLSGSNNPNYGNKWSENIRKKISENHADVSGSNNPMYGKRGKKSPMFGRKWITNGKFEKFVNLDKGLPQGYSLGRLKRSSI